MNKFISVGLIFVLAGCAGPLVTPNPIHSQYKIGPSAQHWQMLASRTADDLVKSLSKIEDVDPGGHMTSTGQTKNLGARPYYIHTSASDAPFAKVFTPLLQEEFLKRGYTISRTPRNATVINYEAQTFYYGGGRAKRLIDYATLWTTAAGFGIAAATQWSASSNRAALWVAGPIIDLLVSINAVTDAEVVLTTSVVAQSNILHQASETLYIAPNDLPLYWSAFSAGAPMETQIKLPVVQPVKTIRVVR